MTLIRNKWCEKTGFVIAQCSAGENGVGAKVTSASFTCKSGQDVRTGFVRLECSVSLVSTHLFPVRRLPQYGFGFPYRGQVGTASKRQPGIAPD